MATMDTLTPPEITAALIAMGEKKAKQAYHITFFKSVGSAWMLCFGAMVVQTIQGGSGTLRTDYPGLISLVAAFFFPVGLIMLVLTGMDLCTGNFLLLPMTYMKGRISLWSIPVNWLIVFFGNLAGALTFVALLAHYSGLYTPGMITYSMAVAVAKSNQNWGACLLRGIGCNYLVCMAILLGTGAREMVSKIAALHFPVFVFVLLGFEHVIVNMYYVPIGIWNGADVSVGQYVARSMIPSFIGNVIGGMLLGIPMVCFYHPVELPYFHKSEKTHDAPPSSTIVRHEDGADTPTSLYEGASTGSGKKATA